MSEIIDSIELHQITGDQIVKALETIAKQDKCELIKDIHYKFGSFHFQKIRQQPFDVCTMGFIHPSGSTSVGWGSKKYPERFLSFVIYRENREEKEIVSDVVYNGYLLIRSDQICKFDDRLKYFRSYIERLGQMLCNEDNNGA